MRRMGNKIRDDMQLSVRACGSKLQPLRKNAVMRWHAGCRNWKVTDQLQMCLPDPHPLALQCISAVLKGGSTAKYVTCGTDGSDGQEYLVTLTRHMFCLVSQEKRHLFVESTNQAAKNLLPLTNKLFLACVGKLWEIQRPVLLSEKEILRVG